ncbi:MAG: serine protease [Planctomycetota bacterium]
MLLILILRRLFAFFNRGSELAERCFPSVALLSLYDSAGHPCSYGCGFFIRPDTVLTNAHVLERAVRGTARLVGDLQEHDIEGVVGADGRSDFLLLKITGVNAPPLEADPGCTVSLGDKVYIVGNSPGLRGTYAQGVVSGFRKVENDSLLQIAASLAPSLSGAPVLDKRGALAGLAVPIFRNGQEMNYVVPAAQFAPLVPLAREPAPLREKTLHRKANSLFLRLGDRNTKGVEGKTFRWQNEDWKSGEYFFRLRNHLAYHVSAVSGVLLFFDPQEKLLAIVPFLYQGVIPSGSVKKMTGSVDPKVKPLTTKKRENYWGDPEDHPYTKMECRVLDFRVSG